jgi:hypothetical protein
MLDPARTGTRAQVPSLVGIGKGVMTTLEAPLRLQAGGRWQDCDLRQEPRRMSLVPIGAKWGQMGPGGVG